MYLVVIEFLLYLFGVEVEYRVDDLSIFVILGVIIYRVLDFIVFDLYSFLVSG